MTLPERSVLDALLDLAAWVEVLDQRDRDEIADRIAAREPLVIAQGIAIGGLEDRTIGDRRGLRHDRVASAHIPGFAHARLLRFDAIGGDNRASSAAR